MNPPPPPRVVYRFGSCVSCIRVRRVCFVCFVFCVVRVLCLFGGSSFLCLSLFGWFSLLLGVSAWRWMDTPWEDGSTGHRDWDGLGRSLCITISDMIPLHVRSDRGYDDETACHDYGGWLLLARRASQGAEGPCMYILYHEIMRRKLHR